MRDWVSLLSDYRFHLWRRANVKGQTVSQTRIRIPQQLQSTPSRVQEPRNRQTDPSREARQVQGQSTPSVARRDQAQLTAMPDARQPRILPVDEEILGPQLPRRRVRRDSEEEGPRRSALRLCRSSTRYLLC